MKIKAMTYFGGKAHQSDWIISLLPQTEVYLEPFFGMGSVFFNKPKSRTNLLNDGDKHIFNLFNVIKNHPDRLNSLLESTLFHPDEFKSAIDYLQVKNKDPVRWANAVICILLMNMRHTMKDSHFVLRRMKSQIVPVEMIDRIKAMSQFMNLTKAYFDSKNAIDFLSWYFRGAYKSDTLIYLDPPYLPSVRSGGEYGMEMTETEHENLLMMVKDTDVKVAISGYASDLYDDVLRDWNRETKEVVCKMDFLEGKKRTEVLWMNYEVENRLL